VLSTETATEVFPAGYYLISFDECSMNSLGLWFIKYIVLMDYRMWKLSAWLRKKIIYEPIFLGLPPQLPLFLDYLYLNAVEKYGLNFPGPTPNVDIVLSICLQSDLPTGQSAKTGISTQVQTGKAGIPSQLSAGYAPATSELSGSTKSHPVPSGVSLKPGSNRQYGKRKESDSMCIIYLGSYTYKYIIVCSF